MKLNSSIAAVVTGGASGLGKATAVALAAKGVKVALFDLNEELGEAAAQEIGGVFCKVDITSNEAVDAAFAKARAAHGQERVLVNCAGIGNGIKTVSRAKATGELTHFPLDAFEKIIQVNLLGTFRCIAKSAVGIASLEPLEDGEEHSIPAGSLFKNPQQVSIYPAFALEVLPNRDSISYKDVYGLKDAHTIFRGTLRYQGFASMMSVLAKLDLFDSKPVDYLMPGAPPMTWVRGKGKGKKENIAEHVAKPYLMCSASSWTSCTLTGAT